MMTEETTLQMWPHAASVSPAKTEPGHSSDLQLARYAARGDMEAFEEIYGRHQRMVYSLCLRMLQNVAEAEDVAQEVFITLFHKIGGFRGEAAFTTWLHRLTVNQVLMRFRKRKARREEQVEDTLKDTHAGERLAGARAAPLIDRIALDGALAQLPPGYRAAFILHDIEGYEHEEVARILGCAVGTSKSQLHKARTKLRKILRSRL
jgi:RNA polymerase sigma-70 factor, ECF subfamily